MAKEKTITLKEFSQILSETHSNSASESKHPLFKIEITEDVLLKKGDIIETWMNETFIPEQMKGKIVWNNKFRMFTEKLRLMFLENKKETQLEQKTSELISQINDPNESLTVIKTGELTIPPNSEIIVKHNGLLEVVVDGKVNEELSQRLGITNRIFFLTLGLQSSLKNDEDEQ